MNMFPGSGSICKTRKGKMEAWQPVAMIISCLPESCGLLALCTHLARWCSVAALYLSLLLLRVSLGVCFIMCQVPGLLGTQMLWLHPLHQGPQSWRYTYLNLGHFRCVSQDDCSLHQVMKWGGAQTEHTLLSRLYLRSLKIPLQKPLVLGRH